MVLIKLEFRRETGHLFTGAVEAIEVDGREFPGSPVVRTLYSHCQGPGSVPGQGTKISQAAEWDQKEKKWMGNLRLHRIRKEKEIGRRNHGQQQHLRGEKEKEPEIVHRRHTSQNTIPEADMEECFKEKYLSIIHRWGEAGGAHRHGRKNNTIPSALPGHSPLIAGKEKALPADWQDYGHWQEW